MTKIGISNTEHVVAALNRNARGIHALEVFEHVLRDLEVFGLIEAILRKTYSRFLGHTGFTFIDEYFEGLRSLASPALFESIVACVLPMRVRFNELGLTEVYTSEFRSSNIDASIRLVGPTQFQGTVIDVGADDNMLGTRLLDLANGVVRVIGLDVEERNPLQTPGMLGFRLQLTRTNFPVANEEADVAVCRYSLHHMTQAEQVGILHEIHRILKETGRCIVYENSYSLRLRPELPDENGFNETLVSIADPVRLRLFLAGLDTFSLGIKNKDMTFPHSFRTVEEWTTLFRQCGFGIQESRYFGVPILDLHQAPLACFILTKRTDHA